jgi:hypothetical protein
VIKSKKFTADTVTAPGNTERKNMAIATESTCPIERIVATIPDAMPRHCFSTELMMAFVCNEEKKAYPSPSHRREPTIIIRGVSGEEGIKTEGTTVIIAISKVATIRGSILS